MYNCTYVVVDLDVPIGAKKPNRGRGLGGKLSALPHVRGSKSKGVKNVGNGDAVKMGRGRA
jgi:hypothetical protein